MPPPNEKNEKNKANATANAKLKLISFIQGGFYFFYSGGFNWYSLARFERENMEILH